MKIQQDVWKLEHSTREDICFFCSGSSQSVSVVQLPSFPTAKTQLRNNFVPHLCLSLPLHFFVCFSREYKWGCYKYYYCFFSELVFTLRPRPGFFRSADLRTHTCCNLYTYVRVYVFAVAWSPPGPLYHWTLTADISVGGMTTCSFLRFQTPTTESSGGDGRGVVVVSIVGPWESRRLGCQLTRILSDMLRITHFPPLLKNSFTELAEFKLRKYWM